MKSVAFGNNFSRFSRHTDDFMPWRCLCNSLISSFVIDDKIKSASFHIISASDETVSLPINGDTSLVRYFLALPTLSKREAYAQFVGVQV